MPPPIPNYAHKATFLEPHDGDSFWLTVDFGLNTHGVRLTLPLYIRLYGIDTWELGQTFGGQPVGVMARDYTSQTLAVAKSIVAQTVKDDGKTVGEEKYGRWLARIWVDGLELATLLRANGHEKHT
jgi:endonuclease YncB( thermonuclease family)